MAGTWEWYGPGLLAVVTGVVVPGTDPLAAMLVGDSYTPDPHLDTYRDDIADEVIGSGYTAGGLDLQNVSVSYNAADFGGVGGLRIAWDDLTWAGASFDVKGVVVYHKRGGPASADEVLAFCINDVVLSPRSGPFTLDFPAAASLTWRRTA